MVAGTLFCELTFSCIRSIINDVKHYVLSTNTLSFESLNNNMFV